MPPSERKNEFMKLVGRTEAKEPEAVVAETAPPSPRPARRTKPAETKAGRPDRKGTRMVSAHLPADFLKQLNILSAEEDITIRDLMEEAINDLLVKKGKKRIK